MTELLDGFVPGLPERAARRRSWRGPKACRSTRSRRCGCCSTAGCSCRRARSTARPARSRRSKCPRRCTGSSPRASTGSRRRSAAYSRTRPFSARRSRDRGSPRSAVSRKPSSTRCSQSLARKEILGVQADPTSPEHGQYGFLQDLVRHVAYETLSKKERRTRHLAAAAYLVDAFPNEDEITEVLASHYLDAYTALPDAEDAAGGQGEGPRRARPGRRPRRVTRRRGRGAPLSRRSAPSSRTRHLERAALLDRAGWLGLYAADCDEAERLLGECDRALRSSTGDCPIGGPRLRTASLRSRRYQGPHGGRRSRGRRRHSRRCEAYEPGAELAELAGSARAGATSSSASCEKALERPTSRSSSPSRSARQTFSLVRSLPRRSSISDTEAEEAIGAPEAGSRDRARARSCTSSSATHSSTSRTSCFRRDRYEDALAYLADALDDRAARAARAPASGASSRRRRTRSSCSDAGTRRSRRSPRCPRIGCSTR